MFFEEGRISWLGRYSWRCQPIDFSQNEFAMRVCILKFNLIIIKFILFQRWSGEATFTTLANSLNFLTLSSSS
jgi:hypothetical protein